MKRKLLSLILCLCLAVSMIPAPVAVAQENPNPAKTVEEIVEKTVEELEETLEETPAETQTEPTAEQPAEGKEEIKETQPTEEPEEINEEESIVEKTTMPKSVANFGLLGEENSNPVATVNDVSYDSLFEAFNVLSSSGGTIVVTGICNTAHNDVAQNADIDYITVGTDITLQIEEGGQVTGSFDVAKNITFTVKGNGEFEATVVGDGNYVNEINKEIEKQIEETPNDYVCQIGDKKYETLEAAIAEAVSGDTIELLKNVELSSMLTISKSVKIDLKEHLIFGSIESNCLIQVNDADAIIENGTIENTASVNSIALFVKAYNNNALLTTNNVSVKAMYAFATQGTEKSELFDTTIYTASINIINGVYDGSIRIVNSYFKITIYGGTFSQDVSDYCADGYECIKNPDGTYTVQKIAHYVCKIGEQGYETLQAAVNAVQKNGQTIELIDNITLASETELGKDSVEYTIDINDQVLGGAVLRVSEGTVTFIGDGSVNSSIFAENVQLTDYGTLYLSEGTFNGTINGNVYISGGSFSAAVSLKEKTITGGRFSAQSSSNYIDDRYEAVQGADNWYTVVLKQENIVATNTTTGVAYPTLATAVAAAHDGESVQLQKDVNESNIAIAAGITLDLNGKTVSSTGNSFNITGGNVTIKNGAINTTEQSNAYAIKLTGGAINLDSISINVSCTSGTDDKSYAVYCNNPNAEGTGNINITNCTFNSDSTGNAYGVYYEANAHGNALITKTDIFVYNTKSDWGRCACVDQSNAVSRIIIGTATDTEDDYCHMINTFGNTPCNPFNVNNANSPFTIYSGYYNFDVSQLMKAGYICRANQDANKDIYAYKVEIEEKENEAELFDPAGRSVKVFKTLSAAVTEIATQGYSSGYTVRIKKNIAHDNTTTIPSLPGINDYSVDLAGFRYTYTGTGNAFAFGAGPQVTIKNGSVMLTHPNATGMNNAGDLKIEDIVLYIDHEESTAGNGTAFNNSGNLEITSGQYHGKFINNGGCITISGGYFQDNVTSEFVAEGYKCVEDATYAAYDYNYSVRPDTGDFAAYIGEQGYETLEAAVNAAQSGNEIRLAQNVVLENTLEVGKNITINLNGFKISDSGLVQKLIKVNDGYSLTISGASGNILNARGNNAIELGTGATVTTSGGVSVSSIASAFSGNGTINLNSTGSYGLINYNGSANITSGSFNLSTSFSGNTTVSGGSFADNAVFNSAATVRGGEFVGTVDFTGTNDHVTVSGGTFNHTAIFNTQAEITGGRFLRELRIKNGTATISGDTTVNSGIIEAGAVTINGGKYTGDLTAQTGTVDINGGDFKNISAVTVGTNAKANVSGGSFTATTLSIAAGTTEITGGDFDKDVSDYIDKRVYECVLRKDGRYHVALIEENEAQIGETKYTTLQSAINAAQDGDKIEVLKNIGINTEQGRNPIEINNGKTFTIDFGDYLFTSDGVTTITGENTDVTFTNGEINAVVIATEPAHLTIGSGYYHRTGSETTVGDFLKGNISIRGGYFPGDPFTDGTGFTPETGYASHKLDEQNYLNLYNYIVTNSADDVAQIENKTYYTITEALNAASDSGTTIILLKDINEDKTININKSVSINLRGHEWSNTASTAIDIASGKNVIITNGELISKASDIVSVIENKAAKLSLESVDVTVKEAGTTKTFTVINNGEGELESELNISGGQFDITVPAGKSVQVLNNNVGTLNVERTKISVSASSIGNEIDVIYNLDSALLKAVEIDVDCSGAGNIGCVYTQGETEITEGTKIDVNRTSFGNTWGIYKATRTGQVTLSDSAINIVAPDISNGISGIEMADGGAALVVADSSIRCVTDGTATVIQNSGDSKMNLSNSALVADSKNASSSCITSDKSEAEIREGWFYAAQGGTVATNAKVIDANFKGKVYGGYFTHVIDVKYLPGPEYSCLELIPPVEKTVYGAETPYELDYIVKIDAVAKIIGSDGKEKGVYKYFDNRTIDNKKYPGALDEVAEGDTIVVLRDYEITDNNFLKANNNANYTFNLNGHIISGTTNQEATDHAVFIISQGKVTVVDNKLGDSSGETFGQIINNNTNTSEHAVFLTGGKLDIPAGAFKTGYTESQAEAVAVDNKTGTPKNAIQATGGYYSHFVIGDYCAPGYECVRNYEPETLNEGYRWRIQPVAGDNVAINEELNILYPTLQEAFDNVTAPGQHIRLLKNIDSTSKLTNKTDDSNRDRATLTGKTAFLKLDNFTIEVSSRSSVIRVGTAADQVKSELSLIGPGTIKNSNTNSNSRAISVYGPSSNPSKLIVDDPEHLISIVGQTATEAGLQSDVDGVITYYSGEIEITGGRYTGRIAMLKGSGSTYKITGGYYTEDVDNGTEHFDDTDTCFVVESYYSIPNPDTANPVFAPYSHKVIYNPEAEIVETGEKGLLSRMLSNAVTGYTVQLLRDVTKPNSDEDPHYDKLCPNGNYGNSKEIGLNLNGHKITSSSVVFTGGYITDTSEGNIGAIKATDDYVRVPTGTDNGGNLPIKLNDGYHFYEVTPVMKAASKSMVSNKQFQYVLSLEEGKEGNKDVVDARAAFAHEEITKDIDAGLSYFCVLSFDSLGKEAQPVYVTYENGTRETRSTDDIFRLSRTIWMKTYGKTANTYPVVTLSSIDNIEDFIVMAYGEISSITGYYVHTNQKDIMVKTKEEK